MSEHESRPDQAEIRAPSSEETGRSGDAAGPPEAGRPAWAWQPLTFRGVAAFAAARWGRLVAVQAVVAALVAGALVWFLQVAWFPGILEAIRGLPTNGVIEQRTLNLPRPAREPLASSGFLALAVNLDNAASLGSASDVRVEFGRTQISICSLLGCLAIDYPAGYLIQFNQPELESWWGAWRGAVLAAVAAATIVGLFLSWTALSVVYAVPVWFAGVFQDRPLSLFASYKLASAALLGPALAMAVAIAMYGFNVVDLLRLLVLWGAHLPLGWVYLYGALRQIPSARTAAASKAVNPFGDKAAEPPKKRRESNPFAS